MKNTFFVATLCFLLSACVAQPPQSTGVFINASSKGPLSCKELEEKISYLEEVPKTETFTPNNNANNTVPFAFKNQYTDELKALKRKAARQGCYDRPAYIAPLPAPNINRPSNIQNAQPLLDTTRQQLTFDQCFTKCKELTNRTNEQCFDSCK